MNQNKDEIIHLSNIKKLANREIEVACLAKMVKADELNKYVQQDMVDACKKGCPNYANKWSCPPFSKDYQLIAQNYDYAYIFCVYTNMDKYADIKNKYLALKAANVTLKTMIEKMARQIEIELDGYALLSGSCRLCKPCYRKLQKPCKRPDKMRYSMEATHLNVSDITKDKLGHELLWYSKKSLPLYTTTVSLVLTNSVVNVSKQSMILKQIFDSLI